MPRLLLRFEIDGALSSSFCPVSRVEQVDTGADESKKTSVVHPSITRTVSSLAVLSARDTVSSHDMEGSSCTDGVKHGDRSSSCTNDEATRSTVLSGAIAIIHSSKQGTCEQVAHSAVGSTALVWRSQNLRLRAVRACCRGRGKANILLQRSAENYAACDEGVGRSRYTSNMQRHQRPISSIDCTSLLVLAMFRHLIVQR